MTSATSTSAATANSTRSGVTRVAVIGFGAMGSGISHVCALAGMEVTAIEPSEEMRTKNRATIGSYLERAESKGRIDAATRAATLDRITTSGAIEDAFAADLVIEAVTENLDIKRDIFAKLAAGCGPDTILASNTSALSVTEIAAAVDTPGRVCGLHFFNPAPVLPLVEVVRAERTDEAIVERARDFVLDIDKEPIICDDTPGFVVNRLLIPLMNDAARVFEMGTATAEDIDRGARFGLNWPIGPLALLDLVGLDVHVHASEAMWEAYREPRFMAPPILQRMVKAGKLGRKTGEGFYAYDS